MAANILSFVEDLNPAQDFWNMKARIIRFWEQQYRLDLILIDEQGSKIQATVKSHLISGFKSQLKEDAVVVINKFGVGLQEDKYKILPLQYKINFLKCTSVKPSASFTGHPYGFSFIPINNILQNRAIDALTVDVIGKVVHCGDLELWQNGGRDVKKMNFDLEDVEGNVLRCTLWSRYAEDFNRYIVSNPSNEMVITIIQHAKIKIWKGLPTVQNDMYGTRVFINEDLDETNTLRKSLILRDGASSQSVLSSQTVYPSRVEFVQNTERKKVDEIREITQEKNCVVLATIKIIEEEPGWHYLACRKCSRKAVTKTEYLQQSSEIPTDFIDAPFDSLWCLNERKMVTSLIPKFKLQVRVQDDSGSISFVMFDREVSKLVGFSATELKESVSRSALADSFPSELNVLINKTVAFKIAISDYNINKKYNVFTVNKICDDADVISDLQQSDNQEEVNQGEGDVKLSDSQDAGSYTGDSLTVDLGKDSATSPPEKRKVSKISDEVAGDQASATKKLKEVVNI